MLVETKYSVGQKFYAPRCYLRTKEESVEVDGKTFTRKVSFYEAVVKVRVINRIQATVELDDTVTSTYATEDWPLHPESYFDKMCNSAEAARMIAAEHEKAGTVFYG